jgi:SurA N-terminal domain/PPIC-type PPIASE domain
MINVMRKHHKTLMIVITALVCISFSWYWNRTDFAQMGNASVGKFYGRSVSQIELQRNMRLLKLAAELGMQDLLRDLTLGAQTENEQYNAFAWNLMVLRHEADQLGIDPSTSEIASAVKGLPAFNGEKGFDLDRYKQLVDRILAPNGFTQAQIEELAADQIALERVKKILGVGISIPETRMRHDFEQTYGKMEASVVRFKSEEMGKDLQVADDQVAKYYEAHKAELKSDEKRQVKFVQFGLTDEQKKLTGKPRIEVLQKLADKANEFTEALQGKGADFDQTAAKFQLPAKTSTEFSQSVHDPSLGSAPQLTQAAFALTNDAPNSEAIQTPEGFTIMHLIKVEPARPLSAEEARPKIVEQLKKQQIQQMVAAKGGEVARKLQEEVQSGKSIEQAATDAGVKLEKIPPFALVDTLPGEKPAASPEPKNDAPDLQFIKQAASSLKPGEVSDYVGTPTGGLVVALEKREELGPAQFEKARGVLEERALTNKGLMVFYEWLRERRHAAGVEDMKPSAATAPG